MIRADVLTREQFKWDTFAVVFLPPSTNGFQEATKKASFFNPFHVIKEDRAVIAGLRKAEFPDTACLEFDEAEVWMFLQDFLANLG